MTPNCLRDVGAALRLIDASTFGIWPDCEGYVSVEAHGGTVDSFGYRLNRRPLGCGDPGEEIQELTSRAREIFLLSLGEYRNNDIAGKLSISAETARIQLHQIHINLRVSDRQ